MNSTGDLRAFLIEQMKRTASGQTDLPQAQAICRFAQQIYNTVKIEVRYAEIRTKDANIIVEPIKWKSPSK